MHPLLPADPRLRLLQLEREKAKRAARSHLLPFTLYTFPNYQVNWHHRVIAENLTKWAKGEIKRLILCVGPQRGKALAIDTPIATPSGWSTMGALRPGDQVFGLDGLPTEVVAVSEVFHGRPVFAVRTDDGETITADASHLWRAHPRKSPDGIYTTQRLFDRQNITGRRIKIGQGAPVDLPDADLPIDPYVLGVWLGDGCSDQAMICEGDQDIGFIRSEIEKAGVRTSDRSTHGTFGMLGLLTTMKAMGLIGNKHIPDQYMRASKRQRLALLQGLIDTDGYVDPTGKIEFCSVDERLALKVQELVWSLGRKASVNSGPATIDGRYICEKYRVLFYMKDAARLPRRAALCRDAERKPHRYVSLEPAGQADTVCIQVAAADGMFLCGRSMLPTHNSQLASRQLPPFIFGLNPNARIIACSYGSDLATDMSRDAKRVILSPEYRDLFPATTLNPKHVVTDDRHSTKNTADQWEIVGHRGAYLGRGVGGGITGKGFTHGIIDDPLKGEDAFSDGIREKVWRWYATQFRTRRASGAGMLVIGTRWHEDDLIGRILREEKSQRFKDPHGPWVVLNLRELREEEDLPYDPRPVGMPIWPERYGLEELLSEREAHPSAFAAMYQQRPAPSEGNIFQLAWMQRRFTQLPAVSGDWRIYGDLRNAGKGPKTSFACFQVWFHPYGEISGRFYLVDQVRGRWDQVEEELQLQQLCRRYPQVTAKRLEAKADAPGVQSHLRDVLPGLELIDIKGSKEDRARAVVPFYSAGNVWLPDPSICQLGPTDRPWVDEFVEEMCSFPAAPNDDQVDTGTLALRDMAGEGKKTPTNLWWMDPD